MNRAAGLVVLVGLIVVGCDDGRTPALVCDRATVTTAVRLPSDLGGLDLKISGMGYQQSVLTDGPGPFNVLSEDCGQINALYQNDLGSVALLVVLDTRSIGLATVQEGSIRWATQLGLDDPVTSPDGWYMHRPVVYASGRQRDLVGWTLPSGEAVVVLRTVVSAPATSAVELLDTLSI